MEYYERAIELVAVEAPSAQFVIFSDDIDWCRKELPVRLPLRDALFISDNPDWLDMALMSRCDHHICANSTFSWWGAFLSENPSPIVPWVTGVSGDIQEMSPAALARDRGRASCYLGLPLRQSVPRGAAIPDHASETRSRCSRGRQAWPRTVSQ